MAVECGKRVADVTKRRDRTPAEPKPDEFEHFVGELRKVDPAGLSGKHKGEKPKPKKKAPPK
jgi:hypothetical protein